jgi:hypothetical protein
MVPTNAGRKAGVRDMKVVKWGASFLDLFRQLPPRLNH